MTTEVRAKAAKLSKTMMIDLPKISDWLDGKDIFITGVTGFLGKVLLEKLIRSSSTINRIYVLIRSKRNKSIVDRINDLKKLELFNIINETQPNWLEKVIPIEGDCSEIRLGISDDDWNVLKENVSVIFHTAASVRFDDPLKSAILLNVRGTREMCQLALESKKLEVFVHVSTTYCNNHYKIVDEKLYPPLGDWKEDIRLATEMNEQELNIVTKLYTHRQANTYTYTKGVAESLVKEMCDGKVPTVIIRPSIVLASLSDPFPGWIDNFNGPGAFALAVAKGISRVQLLNADVKSDTIPVDNVIKMLIVGACWKANSSNTNQLDVLNACSGNRNCTSFSTLYTITLDLAKHQFTKNQLWYPTMILTRNTVIFRILFYILQLIPSIIIDGLLKLFIHKTLLVTLQRKFYNANISMSYFFLHQWTFKHDKMMNIIRNIQKTDSNHFHVVEEYDYRLFIRNALLGGKKYVLNERVQEGKEYLNKMYYVHKTTVYAFYTLICWTILKTYILPILYKYIL